MDRTQLEERQKCIGKEVYDYSDMDEPLVGKVVAIDCDGRYILEFEKLPDQVFAYQELPFDGISFDKKIEEEVLSYPKVSRVEVIGKDREYINTDASNVRISFQDKGMTLKVFLD